MLAEVIFYTSVTCTVTCTSSVTPATFQSLFLLPSLILFFLPPPPFFSLTSSIIDLHYRYNLTVLPHSTWTFHSIPLWKQGTIARQLVDEIPLGLTDYTSVAKRYPCSVFWKPNLLLSPLSFTLTIPKLWFPLSSDSRTVNVFN